MSDPYIRTIVFEKDDKQPGTSTLENAPAVTPTNVHDLGMEELLGLSCAVSKELARRTNTSLEWFLKASLLSWLESDPREFDRYVEKVNTLISLKEAFEDA